ncbi:unnamed protein product [Fraxinus pennsylvanica]|uniref:Uncharacterized protein n=1 Tax=Fraxinus pennsylvanica TaxID=56036 RepID=A0AAD2DRE2_9LAMI|nr:unnamed protein product [Fraxinus pennsylvanica]
MDGLPMEADVLFESSSTLFTIDSSTYKLLYKAYTEADMKELLEKLLTCMDRDGIIPNKIFFLDALGGIGSSDYLHNLVPILMTESVNQHPLITKVNNWEEDRDSVEEFFEDGVISEVTNWVGPPFITSTVGLDWAVVL